MKVQPNAYGLFVDVDLIEFKRTLLNLVNNAIEAFEREKTEKRVKVKLALIGNWVQLRIEDNGSGIPTGLLPKILEGGVTSKKGGYGMGVCAAEKAIESWGGTFLIESNDAEGANVIINLPLAKEAEWFADCIVLCQNATVMVLDDDQAVHYLWGERFREEGFSSRDHIQLIQFYEPNELMEFQGRHPGGNVFFLIDYELLNSETNGLDVIERLNVGNQAYLVTSRYENLDIRAHAHRLKVKILPKSYVTQIPIKVIRHNPDCVFLDDSEPVTFVWKLVAEEKGVALTTFNDISLFKEYVQNCKKEVLIYIDSELQSSQRGEDIAKELYELGYRNIYISSGHPAEHFEHVTWVKGVIPKDPPF